jgi:hypothetical protein
VLALRQSSVEDMLAELWLSFGSLLRAYAALHADPAPQVETTADTIRVIAGDAQLEMRCDPETGAGNWSLTCGATTLTQGRLKLLPEGRIDLDGKTLDLDHAAIDLVASVMNAAANPARDER